MFGGAVATQWVRSPGRRTRSAPQYAHVLYRPGAYECGWTEPQYQQVGGVSSINGSLEDVR